MTRKAEVNSVGNDDPDLNWEYILLGLFAKKVMKHLNVSKDHVGTVEKQQKSRPMRKA